MGAKTRGRPKVDPDRDLRGELLRTSRLLLDQGGPGALSMREVARLAGCTHQAPYHYFEDRETILAALVEDGFEELTRRLRSANELAASQGVRVALIASGRAYVDFALSQPGVFRVMFRPDVCNPMRFPAVLEAGNRARTELDRIARIAHGSGATQAQATILWAHVHGLACLLIDGPLAMSFETDHQRQRHLDKVADDFADRVLVPQARIVSNPRSNRKTRES